MTMKSDFEAIDDALAGGTSKADVDSLESNDFVEEFLEQHPDAPDEAVELAYQMGEMTKTIEQREEEKREKTVESGRF